MEPRRGNEDEAEVTRQIMFLRNVKAHALKRRGRLARRSGSSSSLPAHQFLSHRQFEALTGEEQLAYVEDVVTAVGTTSGDDFDRTLAIVRHYFEVADWILEPEEVNRRLQTPIWDAIWADAERIADVLRQALDSGQLNRSEQARTRKNLDELDQMIEHKRDIGRL